MYKYLSLLTLAFSFSYLPVSAMEADKAGDNSDRPINSAPQYIRNEGRIRGAFSEIGFNQVVEALQQRKLLQIDGEEYVVLKDLPKLRSRLYHGEKVGTNPCYELGLGPNLLKVEQIGLLPPKAEWYFHSYALGALTPDIVAPDEVATYLTIRFTSYNNPHWTGGSRFRFPEPFNDPANQYWSSYNIPTSLGELFTVNLELFTVNFLLKKI